MLAYFFNHTKPYCLLLGMLLSVASHAQRLVQPIHSTKNAKIGMQVLTNTTLPFFDDFSLNPQNFDPKLWINGGARLNNTNTNNHPTLVVASFDGLNANGFPYDFQNEKAKGATDVLSSQGIDLSALSPKDSLYLSFFYQSGGNLESPDPEDSLRVQFLSTEGWQTVWITNKPTKGAFNQAMVVLNKAAFFHQNFQFRYEAFGRRSGMFDAWHIDYVYLDKDRRRNKIYYKDIAVRKMQGNLLKNYTAMPIMQFLRDANPFASEAQIETTNLNKAFDFTTYRATISDTLSKQILLDIKDEQSTLIDGFLNQYKVSLSGIKPITKKSVLKFQYQLNTSDDLPPADTNPFLNTSLNQAVNLKRNDGISSLTVLNDYFAYDDGSAEYGLQMNTRFGKTLTQFKLNEPDAVTGVQICFVPFLRDASGATSSSVQQNIIIQLYDDKDGKPSELLYQQSVPVRYGKQLNDFTPYTFMIGADSIGIPTKNTFYIGWQEISENAVAIGFDKNNAQFKNTIFYNLASKWEQNQVLEGSLMIRPVLANGRKIKTEIVLSNEQNNETDWILSPNPSSGILRWSLRGMTELHILDSFGKILLKDTLQETQQQYDAGQLPKGLYFLQLSNSKQKFTKKIIID